MQMPVHEEFRCVMGHQLEREAHFETAQLLVLLVRGQLALQNLCKLVRVYILSPTTSHRPSQDCDMKKRYHNFMVYLSVSGSRGFTPVKTAR